MMFNNIKLYFTDRSYYKQLKRYTKRQKAYRKAMKRQVKDFCPWSGYYMHEMVKLMLKFYMETYEAGDCCWRETDGRIERANTMRQAFDYAEKLELIEDLEYSELIEMAKKDKAFDKYITALEKKVNATINDSNNKEALLGGIADDYLTDKYTKAMYKIIGEHIWEWCD